MRYYMSCGSCAATAETTDLCSLGSQLNAHAAICQHEPKVVIAGESEAAEFDVETISKRSETQSSKLPLVSNCA
jgi:hypothetical protein